MIPARWIRPQSSCGFQPMFGKSRRAILDSNMEMLDYNPGDAVPVTSSLYRVVHDPPGSEQPTQTFHVGQHFPPCPDCGYKVRYLLPIKVLRNAIET